MVRTTFRRTALAVGVALMLTVSGLPLLSGTARAAGVTASPNTEPNSGSFQITFTGSSFAFLATSVTLTDHSNSSNTFTASSSGSISMPTKTTATFDLLRKLPGVYDITINESGGNTETCTSTGGSPCFTITGVPPTLTLSPPSSIPVGGSAAGSLTLTNPARGYKYSSPGVTFDMSGVVGMQASQLSLTVTLAGTTADVPLSNSAGDIVGHFGPAAFAVQPGVTLVGQLRFAVASGAPTGNLSIEVAFGDMDNDGVIADAVASDQDDTVVTPAPTGSTYFPMTPVRVLDTRSGNVHRGALPPQGALTLVLGGTHGIPTSATAVAMNLTATAGTSSGFLVAYPGSSRPVASNVNYVRGGNSANLVVVPLNTTTHAVNIANGSSIGSVHAVADVVGYYSTGGAVFTPLTPSRLLDTRTGAGAPMAAHSSRVLTVAGAGGVAGNATAAALNITVTKGAKQGYVNVYPTGSAEPLASTVNFATGQTIANVSLVRLGRSGQVTIVNHSGGTLHVLVDVQGYFGSGSASSLHPLTIVRIQDTRSGGGTPLPGHGTLTISLGGKGGVPASGLTMAAVNITVTAPAASGFLTAYPSNTGRPLASNLNFSPRQTIANLMYVKVTDTGGVRIYNGSASPAHVIVDVEGWGSAP